MTQGTDYCYEDFGLGDVIEMIKYHNLITPIKKPRSAWNRR